MELVELPLNDKDRGCKMEKRTSSKIYSILLVHQQLLTYFFLRNALTLDEREGLVANEALPPLWVLLQAFLWNFCSPELDPSLEVVDD